MSFVEGMKLPSFFKIHPNFKREAVKLIVTAIKKMLKNNFIHADLHEGNLLFILKNRKVHLNIIDFGLILELKDSERDIFYNFVFNNLEESIDSFESTIKFFYMVIENNISYENYYQICIKEENIFKKADPFKIINFLKENNIRIKLFYLNLIISLSSLRLKINIYLNK